MIHPVLFEAERLPILQNRTFATRKEAVESPAGDVILVQDPRTGLIYNTAFDPSQMIYGEHYQNEQACSAAFRRHLDHVTAIIERHCSVGEALLEIGCGKGFFLESLLDRGLDVMGVDPAYEGSNPRVIKACFSQDLGLTGDFIVLRHVLEHIPDPVAFLANIAAANQGGTIYIEVPCLDWILQRRAWFDIFYEHVNYFRLSDFCRMFDCVHETGRVFGGQYLFVVADLSTLRTPVAGACDRVTMDGFLATLEAVLARGRAEGDRRRAVWGAASKGVIFSLYMQRAGIEIDSVIDINPVKQNRYLPMTGLKVSSPDAAAIRLSDGDNMFVMNSNYMAEIIALSRNRYSYVAVDL